METQTVIKMTIVAEHVLRERLIDEIEQAGARGYTVFAVDGEGSRHRRVSEVLGGNLQLETLVSSAVAEGLWAILQRDYFPHYAIIAYTQTVQVIRGEKYD
jgi:nitrogen regulatory protein P-II 2